MEDLPKSEQKCKWCGANLSIFPFGLHEERSILACDDYMCQRYRQPQGTHWGLIKAIQETKKEEDVPSGDM